jgi:hypothetical protein
MWEAVHGFVGAAVRSPRLVLRALGVLLFIAAAVSIISTDLQAQTIWNGYAGSNSVQINYATSAAQGVVPLISLSVGGASPANFMFDTGSTGIEVSESVFCANNTKQCTNGTFTDTGSILGYAKITLTSSGATGTGFYVNTTVTINNSNGTPMAMATVPVLIAPGFRQAGVGFGRPETANGLQLYTDSSLTTPITGPNGQLYGRALNPLLNLTQLNVGSGLAPISSSIAPGYVVTQNAVYLGLKPSQVSGTQGLNGPLVSLTALAQPASGATSTFATNSTYAQNATQFDWQTPPMLMQVSNNAVGLNGNYYGSVVVDTGLAIGIITNGGTVINGSTCLSNTGTATGCVNQALVQSALHSATPTNIAISLGGAGGSGSPPAQFVYVFQGVCNTPSTTGCGPSGTKYDGNEATINGQKTKLLIGDQSSQMIPMYPTSGGDSSTNGYAGTNSGFSDANSAAAFLNTGVNFLSYFNVVYDPVNGFIGYVPISNASAPAGLVSVTPVLALQGTQLPIPDGTIVPWSVYLFTSTGQQTAQISAPVDVVLSVENGGTATFNGPISSDTICTNSSCSTSLSTGLVLSSGTFVLNNAINTYTGATTVQSGATLIVNGSIASSNGSTSTMCPGMTVALSGLTVCPGGTVGGMGTLPTTTIYGALSPGNSIGTITVQGNLTFGPTGTYVVELGPKAADHTHVSGTATLAGTVLAAFRPDTYKREHYTLLHAEGGLGGTTFNALSTSGLPLNFDAALSYTPTDVMLDLTAHLGRDEKLPRHHKSIADAISNVFNANGDLPPQFQALFNLTGGNLVNALSLISGEAATGAQQGAFQLGNQFLGIMLDPFVDGRAGLGGSDIPALGFAPGRKELPDDIALAYAQVLKAPPKPPSFEQRWSVWGGAYGGTNRTTGDPQVVGSHDLSARAAGFTAGSTITLRAIR